MVLLAPLKRHSPTNANTVSNEDANSDQLVPKVTRKRAKHTRTRLGCATCRFRHVRCGMERPSCLRCSSTGRVCDFVEDSNNERRSSLLAKSAYVSIVPRPNPNDAIYQPAPQTGRWINFYQGHSAPEFAGYFDVEFWSTTILQLSYREQCVHQMLVAIGSLHESLKSGLAQHSDSNAVSLYKYAEAEYTRAVSLLNTHMTHRGWSALEITLVCSILGIMFEWLRGGYQDAVRHLTSSFNILSTWLSHSAPSSTTTFGSPEGHLIRSQIKPIFHILVLQSRMLPIPPSVPPKIVRAPEQIMPEFSSVAHARNIQLDLLTYVLMAPPKVAGSKGRTHQVVAEPLRQWSDKFALFISQQPQLASNPCVKILKVWRIITEMISLSPFSSEPASLNGLIKKLSTFLDDIESRKIAVDIGAVAIFYYTAAYCRHPETHRRAIALLKSAGGPWGHHVAIKAQQEYARLEDNDLKL
ncbi:C6 zinc finger domain protein [Colletotrichum scovillei]|uniref:C6 zinc finger domain protein n=1 Tax=Colletotrichum scovillei TaxID=1209932 RepID=A0A9P7U619_9PEZI|nr:C6 zinc finger domain protein [Colletotrichum scovillei]KAG7041005.1 C6 zinc finger domain protein [Colletotrichum scovillei]KAG7061038.1 C6 zinc finger domain protein [Colletotrichum scovillei]